MDNNENKNVFEPNDTVNIPNEDRNTAAADTGAAPVNENDTVLLDNDTAPQEAADAEAKAQQPAEPQFAEASAAQESAPNPAQESAAQGGAPNAAQYGNQQGAGAYGQNAAGNTYYNQQQYSYQGNSYAPQQGAQGYYGAYPPQPPVEEKANVGLAILSFIIPLAGLIIFLTSRKEKPKTAKVSGICALVSFIIGIVLSIVITTVGSFLIADRVADDYISDFDSYVDDYGAGEYDYDEDYNSDYDTGYYDEIGGDRQGYVNITENPYVWYDYEDESVMDENILQYTDTTEIITLGYYDGTGFTKADLQSSVTASLDSAMANIEDDVLNLDKQVFEYSDFYGECVYTKDSADYQLFIMLFQSDATSDMIYLAVESPYMSDDEFETFVNEVVNNHSFVNHQIVTEYAAG